MLTESNIAPFFNTTKVDLVFCVEIYQLFSVLNAILYIFLFCCYAKKMQFAQGHCLHYTLDECVNIISIFYYTSYIFIDHILHKHSSRVSANATENTIWIVIFTNIKST